MKAIKIIIYVILMIPLAIISYPLMFLCGLLTKLIDIVNLLIKED